jgi:hypothetical protein
VKLDHDPHCPRLSLVELQKRAKRANVRLVALAERRSPSGRGWHRWLVVRPAPRTAMQVVALQLLFGSDPYREAYLYNRARLVDGRQVAPYWGQLDAWNVLYVGQRARTAAAGR